VAVTDIRGRGDSSADRPQDNPTAVGHDIAALIRHPGGPAVIVGHSFAAKSAGQVAVRDPEPVRGLVLVGFDPAMAKLNDDDLRMGNVRDISGVLTETTR
jgi:pimeloyl-ACP methyl ester carboxylesterase